LIVAFAAAVGGALVLTADRGDTRDAAAPSLTVARLDGSSVELASLKSSSTPTLLWFWAPWCEVCNAEAPAIEQLAQDAGNRLGVVAIGGRDTIANAPPFVARHGLRTPTVVFDEPMQVWQAYRIPGQPAGVLLDREGREQQRWLGAFDPEELLAAAHGL
jgi:thiol-disulfide isomerase/thioredoxin